MDAPQPVNWARTRAFLYGDGLFETIRLRGKKPLFWEDHLERMLAGMKVLGFTYHEAEFAHKLEQGLQPIVERLSAQSHGRLRITVFRAGGGAYSPEMDLPEVVLHTEPLNSDYPFTPQSLTLFQDYELRPTILSQVKSLNALPYILAARHAKEHGYDDAILLSDGYVSETSRANLFARFGDLVVTPGLNRGCLPGTMRKKVVKWLEGNGYEVIQGDLTPANLLTADEVILTNAIQGILPVQSINQHSLPTPSGRKMAATLMNELLNAVNGD